MTSFYEEITSRAYTPGAGLGAGFEVIYYTGKIVLLVSVQNWTTPQRMYFIDQKQWKPRDMKPGQLRKKRNRAKSEMSSVSSPHSPMGAQASRLDPRGGMGQGEDNLFKLNRAPCEGHAQKGG